VGWEHEFSSLDFIWQKSSSEEKVFMEQLELWTYWLPGPWRYRTTGEIPLMHGHDRDSEKDFLLHGNTQNVAPRLANEC
jgi:hypothetical protein